MEKTQTVTSVNDGRKVVRKDNGSSVGFLNIRTLSTVIGLVATGLALTNLSGFWDNRKATSACNDIAKALPSRISFPKSEVFALETEIYWSEFQKQQKPTCRVSPINAKEVSIALGIIRSKGAKFVVKSGGHGTFAGISNIDNGLVIDLHQLRSLTIGGTDDAREVTLGVGLKWGEVYTTLEKDGLTVIGGRVSDVGVGGLTLGGGISFFSNRHGFAADCVLNFEVVLANGTIVNANQKENSDLWWALKGGGHGSNFGIVTSMTVEALQQRNMWAGFRMYARSQIDPTDLYTSYVKLANEMTTVDPDAHLMVSFGAMKEMGHAVAINFDYAKPEPNPQIYIDSGLASFKDPFLDTMAVRTLSNLTGELNAFSPRGKRQKFATLTFSTSVELTARLVEIYYEYLDPVYPVVAGFVPAFVIMPLPVALITHSKNSGGNPLGLSDSEGPLSLLCLSFAWSNATDDATVHGLSNSVIAKLEEHAKSVDGLQPWLYKNYASEDQDVFSSYGAENKARLQDIARAVDPEGIFQSLQPKFHNLF